MSTESKQETLLHLPSEILTNILLRLPVRSIVSCKYTCKQLLQIVSTHEFARSHLSVSTPPGLVIYQNQNESLFKLLEYEDTLRLQSHDLRDLKVMKFDPSAFMDTPPCSASVIWGSVNGLLCLGHNSDTNLGSVYICNPITREVIHLPMPKHAIEATDFDRSGFGLSGLSGQYKVVVNYNANTVNECLVYTLGTTGSWRSVAPDASFGIDNQSTGQFLIGNLHWLVSENDYVPMISYFDLETELFKSFSPPPICNDCPDGVSLVILEDCLCVCDSDSYNDDLVLWVMTEYGVEKSWTRKIAISQRLLENWSCAFYEVIFPVKAFADGGVLFSWENEVLFYYCDKTNSTRSVEVFEDNSHRYSEEDIETIIHTFSFISLKSFGVENVISL